MLVRFTCPSLESHIVTTTAEKSGSAFHNLFDALSGNKKLQAEKARLEAFLSAVPGEYCGISKDRSVIYSPGFCSILSLERIMSLQDIQNQLTPSDSAALEGLYTRLSEDGISFTLNVQDHTGRKTMKVTGVRGEDTEGQTYFNILWLEDITEQHEASATFAEEQKIQQEEIERLQDSLDLLPFPVWIRNSAYRIIWVNIAYAKKTGSRPSEILSQQKEIAQLPRLKKSGGKDVLLGTELAAQIAALGPYGAGAPEPVFAVQSVHVSHTRRVGANHLKITAEDATGRLDCIAWRAADAPLGEALVPGRKVHLAGRLKAEEWNGRRRVQLEVMDAAEA